MVAMPTLARICPTEDSAALREEWNGLLSASSADTGFLKWEWASSWWEAFQNAEASRFILTVMDRGKLVGIAPLILSRRRFCG